MRRADLVDSRFIIVLMMSPRLQDRIGVVQLNEWSKGVYVFSDQHRGSLLVVWSGISVH
jgi:hypothetical protein